MKTPESIDNSADIIDSRDIIARIDYLTEERAALVCSLNDLEKLHDTEGEEYTAAVAALDEWDSSDESAELKSLIALAEEAEGYSPDWIYGSALIRASYFTEYCMEMLADIGDLPRDIPHYIAIDEDQTAENLKVDYTEVDFDGVSYFIR